LSRCLCKKIFVIVKKMEKSGKICLIFLFLICYTKGVKNKKKEGKELMFGCVLCADYDIMEREASKQAIAL